MSRTQILTRVAAGAFALVLAATIFVQSRGNQSQDIQSQGSDNPGAQTESATEEPDPSSAAEPAEPLSPPFLDDQPELTGLDGWLNVEGLDLDGEVGDPASGQPSTINLASFDGQVRIVQFWTFGCFNCTNTLPHLQEIYAEHGDDGLEIIGIHAPEFDYEADVDNIAAAAVDLGVTWPIALDTDKVNFRSWQGNRRFWPRTYVLDREGNVRFNHIGEGKYDELAATVSALLAEPATTSLGG